MLRRPATAFTIVELLIVVTLISVLVSLLLPAVNAAREAARRRVCVSHLGQIVLALQQYEMTHAVYPAGTMEDKGPILNWPRGYHHSWIVRVLPHLEHGRTLNHVDFTVGVYDPRNAPVRRLTLDVLHCPTGMRPAARSDYAAVHHDREAPIDVTNNGVFFLNSRVRHVQITDGLSHTLFVGESVAGDDNLGWMSGTRATLRNTGWAGLAGAGGMGAPATPLVFPFNADGLPELTSARRQALLRGAQTQAARNKINPRLLSVGGFSGPHPGGHNYAFGDGSVQFLSQNIDGPTYRRLGNRHDGRLLDEAKYR